MKWNLLSCIFLVHQLHFGFLATDLQTQQFEVMVGQKFVLPCNISNINSNDYFILWFVNNQTINYNQNRYQQDTDLIFNSIDKDVDRGVYQCTAVHKISGEKLNSELLTLKFKWLHVNNVYLKKPQRMDMITAGMAGQVALKCNISGNLRPITPIWYVNKTRIRPNLSIEFRQNQIRIKNILARDSGLYTCCTRNHMNKNLTCTPNSDGFLLKVTNPPVLKLGPTDITVKQGSSAYLHCLYEPSSTVKVRWRRKGRKAFHKSRSKKCKRRCILKNGTLALHDIQEDTAITYECYAQYGSMRTPYNSASVKLARIRNFSNPVNSRSEVSLGQKFEFNCEVPNGFPHPEIIWKRLRDNLIIGENNGHVARSQNTLLIDNFKEEDVGTYMCMARNVAGIVTRNITLDLEDPPFINELSSKVVHEGANVTWKCEVGGVFHSSSEPLWFKNKIPIHEIENKRVIESDSLSLLSVEQSDEGDYSCSFSTPMIESNSASLRITEQPLFVGTHDVCIIANKINRIPCSVVRTDITRMEWKRLDTDMSKHSNQTREANRLYLIFNQTHHSDRGDYQCIVEDSSGKEESKKVRVDVVSPLSVSSSKQLIDEGEELMLNCTQDSVGLRKAAWSRGRGPIRSYHEVLSNGSLLIRRTRLQDSGDYRCSSSMCGSRYTATVTVEIIPARTTHIFLTNNPHDIVNSNHTLHIILLSIFGGIAYLLITIGVIMYCRRKHGRKTIKEPQPCEEKMLNGDLYPHTNHDDVILNVDSKSLVTLDRDVVKRDYPVENICPVTVIGKGEFGDVFLSKAPGIFPDLDDDILVMVKAYDAPTENSSISALRSDFYREINILHRVEHENIVGLLAVSSNREKCDPVDYLLTEYLEWGILKLCLQASRKQQIPQFSKRHKMMMCCQIACALEHLDGLGIRHNDVATRNCVVSSQLLVKLSFLGLTREGFENEYSNINEKRLPIRWMAPELFLNGTSSPYTDVWSYGVTCWEIFTLAQLPYSNLTDFQVLEELQSDQPATLPPLDGSKRISSLIRKCCQLTPETRPDMKQISRKLQSILNIGDFPTDDTTELSGKTTDDQTITSDDKQSNG